MIVREKLPWLSLQRMTSPFTLGLLKCRHAESFHQLVLPSYQRRQIQPGESILRQATYNHEKKRELGIIPYRRGDQSLGIVPYIGGSDTSACGIKWADKVFVPAHGLPRCLLRSHGRRLRSTWDCIRASGSYQGALQTIFYKLSTN